LGWRSYSRTIAGREGLLFLCLPPATQAAFYRALHFETYFYAYLVVALVLGGYLIYGGFKQEPAD
jgi:hypothetical protein